MNPLEKSGKPLRAKAARRQWSWYKQQYRKRQRRGLGRVRDGADTQAMSKAQSNFVSHILSGQRLAFMVKVRASKTDHPSTRTPVRLLDTCVTGVDA